MNAFTEFFMIPGIIDQEAILRFFDFVDPQATFSSAEFLDVSAPVSTAISMETLKLVVSGLLERYQTGLGLLDLENIVFFITFIRFIILAVKYNIKTSFYICCISCFAGVLWYSHFKDLRMFYGPMLSYNRFTAKLSADMRYEDYVRAGKKAYKYVGFLNKSPIIFLKSCLVYVSERNSYRIDPLSMVVANLPDAYKVQGSEIYYKVYNNILPKCWSFSTGFVGQLLPIMVYSTIVRVNKKYCPYLIRWHWTFIMISTCLEGETSRVLYRLYTYIHRVLIPTGRFSEAGFLQTIFTVVVGLQFFCLYLGMLHAVCGQYFYVPFITENTEIHIGKRPQNSIYSGGYTSWQESNARRLEIRTKYNIKFEFPRLWWGWFGKRLTLENIKEREYRDKRQNRIQKKRNKKFKKFIRKLKNWISRS
tara:strand:- start:572 stop:1831 length:1260 start_codon:yes stop_codon:yes gene_type:complete